SLTTAITPTAIALGNFDGVHVGHQAVIGSVLTHLASGGGNQARAALQGLSSRQNTKASGGLVHSGQAIEMSAFPIPTVMTFLPHPQEFFSGQARPLLTPLPEKAAQISQLGVGQLVLLPFDQQLANLSPEDFVESLLIDQLQVASISVGKDFCFGKQRQGTVDDLKTLAARHGVQVSIASLTCLGTERISSSRIRQALASADMKLVKMLLGRPYSLLGRVVQGQQLGRTLGFPTANLLLPAEKFLPRTGVYSVWVQGAAQSPYDLVPAVMNLGSRPTVKGVAITAEVHLLNWTGDLYGKTLEVHLHNFLRPEQAFDSFDALKSQIQSDCQRALGELTRQSLGSTTNHHQ
ncbi:MAG: bifunctional riboflavin kinase/FAD synthetase, partial [Nodosilinea sp.]